MAAPSPSDEGAQASLCARRAVRSRDAERENVRTRLSCRRAAPLNIPWANAEERAPMSETVATQCCIAGGGPAGVMLGFLLARAGVRVVVLEKHADFFRDFRG